MMWNLEACAVCLSTEGKLLDMDDWEQREDFNSVARLNTYAGDGLLSYLCVECSAYVKRCKRFQTKCQRANNLLQEMLNKKKQITHFDITSINREKLDLLPSLAYWRTGSCHYIETEFNWAENNEICRNKHSDVPVFFISITNNFVLSPKSEFYSVEYLDDDEEDIKIETVDNSQSVSNYVEMEVTEIDNTNQNISYEVPSADENGFQDDVVNCDRDKVGAATTAQAAGAAGSTLDQQYANFYRLSVNQQEVVAEITKLFSDGPYKCSTCSKRFNVLKHLEEHSMKYHQKFVNDLYYCDLCSYYFKTKYIFNSHMVNKHVFKYVCTKCPEVTFDRLSAMQHYVKMHLPKGPMSHGAWYDMKRGWIRYEKRTKAAGTNKENKKKVDSLNPVKTKRITKVFFVCTPLEHLEQYELVNERQKSKNYTESKYKCKLCFRGFRGVATFNNHLKKHDPKYSGSMMCDVCKLCFKNRNKLRLHIFRTHNFRYNCLKCQFVCYNSGTAQSHNKWHNKVTYSCPHCDMEFSKRSTQLGHIRRKHTSTIICNICGHSFISRLGLSLHVKRIHSKEELELSEQLSQQVSEEGELYCEDCKMHFASEEAFRIHLGSSNKHTDINLSMQPTTRKTRRTTKPNNVARFVEFTPTDCEKCGKHLPNKVKARQHYNVVHPETDMLQLCDICGFSSKTACSMVNHIRTHTKEKPFACRYCDKRFSLGSNRDRHHKIHTGEKRYECSHCHRRFGVKFTLKLHIQTVHLKIPYPPWNKKNRKCRPKPELCDSPSKSKQLLEKQGEYLDAYILSYQDEEV